MGSEFLSGAPSARAALGILTLFQLAGQRSEVNRTSPAPLCGSANRPHNETLLKVGIPFTLRKCPKHRGHRGVPEGTLRLSCLCDRGHPASSKQKEGTCARGLPPGRRANRLVMVAPCASRTRAGQEAVLSCGMGTRAQSGGDLHRGRKQGWWPRHGQHGDGDRSGHTAQNQVARGPDTKPEACPASGTVT